MIGLSSVTSKAWQVVVGGLASLLIFSAAANAWQYIHTKTLDASVAKAQTDTATCRADKQAVANNRDELKHKLAEQSAAVDRMASDQAAQADRADAAAADLHAKHVGRRRVIPEDVKPDAVNAEIRDRLREVGR